RLTERSGTSAFYGIEGKRTTAKTQRREDRHKENHSMYWLRVCLRAFASSRSIRFQLDGRQDASRDLAEADAVAVALAPSGDYDAVAVLDAGTRLPVGEGDRLSPLPREFEQAAVAVGRGAGDRAAGEQVAGLEVAAVDRVMRELLGHAPVHVLEVRFAD